MASFPVSGAMVSDAGQGSQVVNFLRREAMEDVIGWQY